MKNKTRYKVVKATKTPTMIYIVDSWFGIGKPFTDTAENREMCDKFNQGTDDFDVYMGDYNLNNLI